MKILIKKIEEKIARIDETLDNPEIDDTIRGLLLAKRRGLIEVLSYAKSLLEEEK